MVASPMRAPSFQLWEEASDAGSTEEDDVEVLTAVAGGGGLGGVATEVAVGLGCLRAAALRG